MPVMWRKAETLQEKQKHQQEGRGSVKVSVDHQEAGTKPMGVTHSLETVGNLDQKESLKAVSTNSLLVAGVTTASVHVVTQRTLEAMGRHQEEEEEE